MYTLRSLQDADRIKERVDQGVQQAVLLGGGFISLELAENFVRRGIATTVVEKNEQILAPFDKEMTAPIVPELLDKGVTLLFNQTAEALEQAAEGLVVCLHSGLRLPAQLVIFGVGVRVENKLAVAASLEVGPRGGRVVAWRPSPDRRRDGRDGASCRATVSTRRARASGICLRPHHSVPEHPG